MSPYDLLLCTETLLPDRRHVYKLVFPEFDHPVLLCRDSMPRARGIATYVRDGFGTCRQHKFKCDCSKMLVFRLCVALQNSYLCSLYCNPDQGDRIYKYLLTSMVAVQAEDVHASFLFMSDLNCHHQIWLVIGIINAHGGTPNLLMTNLPDLLQVTVISPLDDSDHWSIVQQFQLHRQWKSSVILQPKLIGLQFVVQYLMPCQSIWTAASPVEVFNEHMSLLVEYFVLTEWSECLMTAPAVPIDLKQVAEHWCTRYGVGHHVRKFQVSAMKIGPVACIWSFPWWWLRTFFKCHYKLINLWYHIVLLDIRCF